MFGSNMIEVAIGLTFFYILLALICSTVNEWITMLLKLRADNLEKGIRNLLDDPTGQSLAKAVYEHPLVVGLSKKNSRPSYISSKNFTRVLLDVVKSSEPDKLQESSDDLRKNIERMPESNLKKSLLLLVDDAGGNIIQARKNIELWYDESMERISGWYKRKVRWVIMGIALVITISLNADTFAIANALYKDAGLRASIVQAANQQAPVIQTQSDSTMAMTDVYAKLDALELPIGWSAKEVSAMKATSLMKTGGNWLLKITGLLFTAFAISLGAPFWFDTLNKFNSLRGSGGRPKPTEEAQQKT